MVNAVLKWDQEKSDALRVRHGIGFEEIELAIDKQQVLADIKSPSKNFPHQRMLIVWFGNYTYAVPYVQENDVRFFKTLFPSRVMHKKYGAESHGPKEQEDT